jgi:hypothetical protein
MPRTGVNGRPSLGGQRVIVFDLANQSRQSAAIARQSLINEFHSL